MLQIEKAALRRVVLRSVQDMAPEERSRRSALVVEQLVAEPSWSDSSLVLGFLPFREEVAITPLLEDVIASGRSLWLPRVQGEELVFHRVSGVRRGFAMHRYGMQEPTEDLPRLDAGAVSGRVFVIAPGVAFDRNGNRLGRGKGYYDRFLRGLRRVAPYPVDVVAVCFSEQLVAAVPRGPEDEAVDAVATDRELVRVRHA